jgi:hypothetical protein
MLEDAEKVNKNVLLFITDLEERTPYVAVESLTRLRLSVPALQPLSVNNPTHFHSDVRG